MPRKNRVFAAFIAAQEQRQWVAEHGGTRAGYVARYGSGNDPDHYGDGGERIFDADWNELMHRESVVKQLTGLDLRRLVSE